MSDQQPLKIFALPQSTYRLQFHAGFTFHDATEMTRYLADLGITHVYASPYLKARPGSTHGYDVLDHCALNPELGSVQEYEQWVDVLKRNGMSHILDTVPNHVGVGTNDNAWWNDVLENGLASKYAEYFDINWKGANRAALRDKVLLPVLGQPYGRALEKGELKLVCAEGSFAVHYYDRRFPISPASYELILSRATESNSVAGLEQYRQSIRGGSTASQPRRKLVEKDAQLAEFLHRAAARFNGQPGKPSTFDLLDKLLSSQHYRLAYWKVAPDEINYRRFFDINDLAALRMERADVFQATHKFILKLLAEGKIGGLRIDHPDGLYDPPEYLRRLQRAFAAARGLPESEGDDKPLYVTVEKILAVGESLPLQWPVAGTTGYDFLNQINGWFIDAANSDAFDEIYLQWTGDTTSFADLAYEKKLLLLDRSFSSELHMLARQLDDVAQSNRDSRDFTLTTLRESLRQIIACFPVYRSYIAGDHIHKEDRRYIEDAIQAARLRDPLAGPEVYQFLHDTLLLDYPERANEADRELQRRFVGKFQQLTAPVIAKGIEDTAFYCYHRFVSLNEVGGDPARFGVETSELHGYLQDRQRHWPHALSALSTHDTKRSEDVRARLNVLSEVPQRWTESVKRWAELNNHHLDYDTSGESCPDPAEEYLLYQSILGAWPIEAEQAEADFVQRICDYTLKALREAKVHTSWTNPREAYEKKVLEFVRDILDGPKSSEFLKDFVSFVRWITPQGLRNSLAQTLLRLTCPGVPDTYQGCELWDFSLVDPDNRRPVDYAKRRRLLDEMGPLIEKSQERIESIKKWSHTLGDGRLKLLLTALVLRYRRQHSRLFSSGGYEPLQPTGAKHRHLLAFKREQQNDSAIVIVTRLGAHWPQGSSPLGLKSTDWRDTRIPTSVRESQPLIDLLTGISVTRTTDGYISLADLPDCFPGWILVDAAAPGSNAR